MGPKRRRLASRSLALRLFLHAAGWSIVALVITGFVLSSLFRETVEKNFDNYLNVYLKGLSANIEVEKGDLVLTQNLTELRFEFPLSGWYWQVMEAKFPLQPVYASPSLLEFRLQLKPWTEEEIQAESRAYFLTGPGDRTLRVVERRIYLPGSDSPYVFTVAGDNSQTSEVMATFNRTLIITLAILGVGLMAAVLLQVKLGLQPLREIRRSLEAIRSGKEQRLKGEFPREIAPLARELNVLIDNNREVIERARTHVGNLAHALKTPLSVLTNEADANPGKLATKVAEQTRVMRDQVNHYLDRARVAARANVIGSSTNVEPVVEGILRVLNRVNEHKGIDAGLTCPEGVKFRGEKQDLEEMVGNLVDNAFKWADQAIAVTVLPEETDEDGGKFIHVFIEDDGPGLPEESLKTALKRGRRFDESKPGSGLGLSIVADIASLYKGSFALEISDLGGLKAILRLPAA